MINVIQVSSSEQFVPEARRTDTALILILVYYSIVFLGGQLQTLSVIRYRQTVFIKNVNEIMFSCSIVNE